MFHIFMLEEHLSGHVISCLSILWSFCSGVREPKKNKDEVEMEGWGGGEIWYEAVMMIDMEINVNWWLFIEERRQGEGDRMR